MRVDGVWAGDDETMPKLPGVRLAGLHGWQVAAVAVTALSFLTPILVDVTANALALDENGSMASHSEAWTLPGRVLVTVGMLAAWIAAGPTAARRPLQLLALATVLDTVAFAFFVAPDLFVQFSTAPVGDVFQLSAYVATIAALFSFGRARVDGGSLLVAAIDLLLTVGGFGLVVWTFLIHPAPVYAADAGWIGSAVELGYPVLDVVFLFALYAALRTGMHAFARPARVALTVHVAATFVGDGLLGVALYVASPFALLVAIGVMQTVTQTALAVVAYATLAASSSGPMPSVGRPDVAEDGDDVEPALSPISAVAVAVAVVSMVVTDVAQSATGGAGPVASIGVAALGLMLVGRQILVSSRNRAWMRDQRTELERKVTERTRELAEANASLQRLATVDELTGIANRRRFESAFDEAWSTCLRSDAPLSVVMIDVDAFKAYNDHYGHQHGDRGLATVARVLRSTVRRETDLVARYGGEEFAILCVATDADGARALAEAIREDVARLALPHDASPVARQVTVSIGVACTVPQVGEAAAELVRRADEALYEAKRSGRNRVIVAPA